MIGNRFAQGRAQFADRSPYSPEPTAKVFVRVRLGGFVEDHLAQLDTGAAWSVLAPTVAKRLGIKQQIGLRERLSTRLGIYDGQLVRIPIIFVAEQGQSLETEGTFFICRDWPLDVTFLGYSGLLDRIRFALDPQANDFYFGAS
jgi:hypothetical protein